jgi:tRNA (mo5U34)-methyltransferase
MMFDFDRLREDLAGFASAEWIAGLVEISTKKTSDAAHGNLRDWRNTLGQLPDVGVHEFDFGGAAVSSKFDWPAETKREVREILLALLPWRKGPFDIAGIEIDTEWRSDLKWQRLAESISPLADRRVLDVGCGNGYYALRMHGMGARLAVGIDPTLLFVVQFAALTHFMRPVPVHVLPLRLHELPESGPLFDTTFSMGVLYHQRDPAEHLTQLKQTLRSGGELVLESLIAPGDASDVLIPEDRYARMRNVWHLPTIKRLTEWLDESGFSDIRVIDQTLTTIDEQRTTEWMPYESLGEALDPSDPEKTVEGLPAPLRIVMTCKTTQGRSS